jgi:ADP-ribosylglycohydrolase
VEGWGEGQIRAVYGHYCALPDDYPWEAMPTDPKVRKKLRPLGLHSDDTQQALALLLVSFEGSSWDNERYAKLLCAGMRQGAWRGFGRNFQSAVHKLSKASPAERAGSSSAGIGAAMRVAPLGARYHDEPELLARAVLSSSFTTHGDIQAGAIAYAVAWSVARLVAGESAEEVRRQLPAEVERIETEWLDGHAHWTIDRRAKHIISEGLAALEARAPASFEELRQAISTIAKPHLADGFTKAHPNQGFALLGGAHALWMALWPKISPQDALGEIIRQGYDTDTVAAIAGGILGARVGASFVPVQRFVDADRLLRYADALADGNSLPETESEFLARESALSQEETAYQKRVLARRV